MSDERDFLHGLASLTATLSMWLEMARDPGAAPGDRDAALAKSAGVLAKVSAALDARRAELRGRRA